MPYTLPDSQFDALDQARNKLKRANQMEQLIIDQFKTAFEDFWGVDPAAGGSRYTSAQMQQIIDAMPQATALDVLGDAAALRDFIQARYPGGLEDRYQSTAFDVSIVNGAIVIGELKPAWRPADA